MLQIKLVMEGDAAAAEAAEAALVALQDAEDEAAPHAVSRFEAGLPNWKVEAYFDGAQQPAVVVLAAGLPGTCRLETVADENWVAVVHATLAPVPAGRFLIHGPHDRAAAAGSGHPWTIEIEASEAFGTAHHGSTVGCLHAIDDLAAAGRNFPRALDLGTGSGILAIAAARVFPGCAVLATDMDARSVEIALENSRLNGVGALVEGLFATGVGHPRFHGARFPLILANILAEPLITLAPRLAALLEPQGLVVLAGLLTTQAAEVTAAYTAAGLTLQQSKNYGDWTTLVLSAP